MKLWVITPLATAVDELEVAAIRAEDESGSFGILPGHADLLTALTASIVVWRKSSSSGLHFCAVRGGVLSVRGGREVDIATREAVLGDDLDRLEAEVLVRLRSDLDAERVARVDSARLHIAAVREIVRRLRGAGDARAGAMR